MVSAPRAWKMAPLSIVACFGCALALSPLAGARVAGEHRARVAPDIHVCSTAGLSFSLRRHGTTLGDDVVRLRSQGIACAGARSIARKVAVALLHERPVPVRIDGMEVKLKRPCAGCTPNTRVAASGRGRTVTFTVRGGA